MLSYFCTFMFSHFAFYDRLILTVLTHFVCISGSSDVWRNFKGVILNNKPVDFVVFDEFIRSHIQVKRLGQKVCLLTNAVLKNQHQYREILTSFVERHNLPCP